MPKTYRVYNYVYGGIESQKFSLSDGVSTGSDTMNAIIFGAESTIGQNKIKFVYGGEFGLGKYNVDNVDLSFTTFSAEPFIGVRYDITDKVALNARLGYKAIKLMETNYQGADVDGTITGINSSITVGYRF